MPRLLLLLFHSSDACLLSSTRRLIVESESLESSIRHIITRYVRFNKTTVSHSNRVPAAVQLDVPPYLPPTKAQQMPISADLPQLLVQNLMHQVDKMPIACPILNCTNCAQNMIAHYHFPCPRNRTKATKLVARRPARHNKGNC